jgi:hypothetical protein
MGFFGSSAGRAAGAGGGRSSSGACTSAITDVLATAPIAIHLTSTSGENALGPAAPALTAACASVADATLDETSAAMAAGAARKACAVGASAWPARIKRSTNASAASPSAQRAGSFSNVISSLLPAADERLE